MERPCRRASGRRPRRRRAISRAALTRDQLGVAGAEPDAVQPCRSLDRRSLGLAGQRVDRRRGDRAMPPRRPRTTRYSRPRRCGQRLLRLGRADEPDRDAEHRRRPRRAGVEHLEQVEQRGRRVADRDDRAAEPVAATARARRRCGWCPAAPRAPARAGRAGCRRPRCRRAAGARVTPEATICASQRIGAPARSAVAGRGDDAGGAAEVADQVDLPAGVDHADGDRRDVGRQPGEVGLGADRGERAAVDLRAVADVARASRRQSRCGCDAVGGYPPPASATASTCAAGAAPQRRAQPETCSAAREAGPRATRARVGPHVGAGPWRSPAVPRRRSRGGRATRRRRRARRRPAPPAARRRAGGQHDGAPRGDPTARGRRPRARRTCVGGQLAQQRGDHEREPTVGAPDRPEAGRGVAGRPRSGRRTS